ncbi:MAG: hypothetical protein ACFC1C_00745 [Candidatus Malihini olakiniferum]
MAPTVLRWYIRFYAKMVHFLEIALLPMLDKHRGAKICQRDINARYGWLMSFTCLAGSRIRSYRSLVVAE